MMEAHNKLCPKFESAFEILGKRWTGLIIRTLLFGQHRFSKIAEMIPQMSDRMLAERLKELEHEGIVYRDVHPETPVRIEYGLTPKGLQLESIMNQVQQWADDWIEAPNHIEEN